MRNVLCLALGLVGLVGLVGLGLVGSATFASCHMSKSMATYVQERLSMHLPQTEITHIKCTNMEGLYEVDTKKNIFYTSATGNFMVVGMVYDLEAGRNLTDSRMKALKLGEYRVRKVRAQSDLKQSSFLLNDTYQKGKPSLTVLFDIHCHFCRGQYEQLIEHLGEVNVTIALVPLFPDPTYTQEGILCVANPAQAFKDVLGGKAINTQRCGKGSRALTTNQTLMGKAGIHGTPVLIREDGTYVVGLHAWAWIKAWLGGSHDL